MKKIVLSPVEEEYKKDGAGKGQHPELIKAYSEYMNHTHHIKLNDEMADIFIIRAILKGNDSQEFLDLKNAFHNVKIPDNISAREKVYYTPHISQAFYERCDEFSDSNQNKLSYYDRSDYNLKDINGFGEKQKYILKKGSEELLNRLNDAKKSLNGAGWENGGEKLFKEHYVSPNDSQEVQNIHLKGLKERLDAMIDIVETRNELSIDKAFKPFISSPNDINPRYGESVQNSKISISDKFWYKTDIETVIGRLAHEYSHVITKGNTDDIAGIMYGEKKTAYALDHNQSNGVFNNADSFRLWLMEIPLGRNTYSSDYSTTINNNTMQALNNETTIVTDTLSLSLLEEQYVVVDENQYQSI